MRTRFWFPQKGELQFAREVLDVLPQLPLYARVDVIRADDGRMCLIELELVEPGLGLEFAPHAVERFADAIMRKTAG